MHKNKNIISKHVIILMIGMNEKLGGMTRFQKLIFLLLKESGVNEIEKINFNFEPNNVGPLSRKLYDEIEMLENLGYIKSKTEGYASKHEASEISELSFSHLIDNHKEYLMTADSFEEKHFSLTDKGFNLFQTLTNQSSMEPIIKGILKINLKFINYSLQDLLYYIFTKYNNYVLDFETYNEVIIKGDLK